MGQAICSHVRLDRNEFQIESLEPRILLSGDSVLPIDRPPSGVADGARGPVVEVASPSTADLGYGWDMDLEAEVGAGVPDLLQGSEPLAVVAGPKVALSAAGAGTAGNTLETARDLSLSEQPPGGGYFVATAEGVVDPATYGTNWSDPDYWKFQALPGDLISISVDTPDSGLDPFVELRNASDAALAGDDHRGPGNDALMAAYRIEATGTYYVAVGKNWWSTTPGSYRLRVDLTRGVPLEDDGDYANDTPARANPLELASAGNHRTATIAGNIMASEGANRDEDMFGWGTINAGVVVDLKLRLPALSDLEPILKLVDFDGQALVDEDGNVENGHFRTVVPAHGRYYASVAAVSGEGTLGIYLLDVDLLDSVPPEVARVSGLPPPGETSGQPLSSFTVEFTEDLAAGTVNPVNPLVIRRGDHAYFLTPEAMPWAEAEVYATSLGGHLASLGDAAEQELVAEWFAAANPWIGLTDRTTEGTWLWTDGGTADYTFWDQGEPNDSDGRADFAFMWHGGPWQDSRGGEVRRGVVELVGAADTDGDGIPNVIDVDPQDALNGWDLREAGSTRPSSRPMTPFTR
ncbi:MAG: LEPR-XLL domain-containing protein [Verrucomicrobia bacterium]|nr:LEPR-XLL domain-containing protein [Verrucomicrobiota bacterium]